MKKLHFSFLSVAAVASSVAGVSLISVAQEAPSRDIFGLVQTVEGSNLSLKTRTGAVIQVDASGAIAAGMSPPIMSGHSYEVVGSIGASGVLDAERIARTSSLQATWPPDK